MIYKSFSQNNTNKQKRHSKKKIRVEVDNSHLNFFFRKWWSSFNYLSFLIDTIILKILIFNQIIELFVNINILIPRDTFEIVTHAAIS